MRNPLHTPFFAVFQNEVRLNSKRVAPYALTMLFVANAMLWWFKGPARALGWATNSDWYIARSILAFSFLLGLPIFNAVIMGEPVIKDFGLGVDPLIFSKPINRTQYLLGKFFGNFFVLVCCQATFPLTFLVLQPFRLPQMVVLPFQVFPYFKHFFFFLVITHLVLGAIYFTVGTLSRNSKIVYGVAACFYPIIIAYGLLVLRPLPFRWRLMLDPFLLSASLKGNGFLHSAEFLNQYVVRYTADMIANRLVMILVAAICLTLLYVRFSIVEKAGKAEKLSVLNLSTATEKVYYDIESFQQTRSDQIELPESAATETPLTLPIPLVATANEGIGPYFQKLLAALGLEFRLLRAERSLVAIMPVAVFLSVLEVAFYDVPPEVSYSAAYAVNTAKLSLLFLFGITVFYTGESMHRDREIKTEPVLWSLPVPNSILILSKVLTTTSLAVGLLVMVGLISLTIQIARGHWPLEVFPYLVTYAVILLPTIILTTAAAIALNVLLRDKYLSYVVSIATGAGLIYLYNLGYNHWLYNPALYQLWTYPNLTGAAGGQGRILIHRIYCLALSVLFLAVAHLCFSRKPASGLSMDGRLGSIGWGLVITLVSLAMAVVAGLVVK
jgi:ABC-type transport system involved in multi-copper enzyme maturation permease subunit